MEPADGHHPVEAGRRLGGQHHILAHHAGHKMAAGGMAGKAERPAAEIRDGIGGSRDFGCDLCDPRLRRQRVANHRHRPATRQRARGKMREIILRQRHPVAAMHNGEHAPRGLWVALRREKVVSLALTLP